MSPRVHTALGPGTEFDHVRAVWKRLGRTMQSSGDDCAFIPVAGATLAISTDLSLENVHFRAGWMDWRETGYRAGAAALSDLAAVAAVPMGMMVSVGVSHEFHDDVIPELMAGIGEAARGVSASVWGGDTTRSESVVMDVTVVGKLEHEPVRRSGAEPGDHLYVTGQLGGPAAAVDAWEDGDQPDGWARERFTHPMPRISEGLWLFGHGATAMIDVSDGLVADAGHLAAASGVGCQLNLEAVPAGPGISREAAATGGEEYELLVTFPQPLDDAMHLDFQRTFGIPLTAVGRCTDGNEVEVRSGDERVSLEGFRHFG